MFHLPQCAILMAAAIPVQDPSSGNLAMAPSQTMFRRTVVRMEAAYREGSGCEDGDPFDGRYQPA